MRTSGTHSDATLTIIPAVVLLVVAMMMVGGVDDTLRTIDHFCRSVANTVIAWFKAAW